MGALFWGPSRCRKGTGPTLQLAKRDPSGCPHHLPRGGSGGGECHARNTIRSTILVHSHGRLPCLLGEDRSCPGRASSRSRGKGDSHVHVREVRANQIENCCVSVKRCSA